MRISDWSSDVCSSDLRIIGRRTALALGAPRFALGTVGLQLLDLLRRQRRDQLCGDSATQYHLVMRDLARLIGEFGAGATVVLGGRVELGESAMQVATALEQFALLGVVFDGDGVDREIGRAHV